MPPRTKKTKKDGRKRTSSTVSNTADNPKNPEKGPSQPAEKPNGANHKQPLKSQAASGPSSNKSHSSKMPNVFEFLDENESSSDSSDHDELPPPAQGLPKIQSPEPRSSPVPHGVFDAAGNILQSLAGSPSVVATRSSSDSRQSRTFSGNQLQLARKPTATGKPSPVNAYSSDSSAANESPVPGKRQLELSRPENFYSSSRDHASLHRPPLPPSPPSSPEDSPHRESPAKRRHSSAPQVSSGYGFVASHLTRSAAEEKSGFSPLYRRFENLNHRVLLHLQDEISQMEEDLHTLDEYEEMHRAATAEQEGTKPPPGSRRLEVQSQVYSSLHRRRMELMDALTQKTEQYSKFALPNHLQNYDPLGNTDFIRQCPQRIQQSPPDPPPRLRKRHPQIPRLAEGTQPHRRSRNKIPPPRR